MYVGLAALSTWLDGFCGGNPYLDDPMTVSEYRMDYIMPCANK